MKQTVLITGAGGSLGKRFVGLLHGDYQVIGVDHNEWSCAELTKEFPDVEVRLDDFTNFDFEAEPVDYLIHCAAYKHVNLGEDNPEPFIDNNILKTMKLFKTLYRYAIPFVFISTDKAVEPISLYGFTKAIGEKLALFYGGSVARLGNILNSSGSVIPVWEKCIEENRPIPITDERMVRYFIEDFEAVDQIWDMFKSGEKVIIPKCKKIRLLDLLTEVLKRHGKTIDEVSVEVIGLRPGEKIEEKLEWT